jgi:colicin import membrane protein
MKRIVSILFVLTLGLCFWPSAALRAEPALEKVRTHLDEGRLDQALQDVQNHLLRHPQDPQGLFLHALILEKQGRIADAMHSYQVLIALRPDLPEPYNNLAALLADQGEFDKASEMLQEALRTHPSYASAHQNLGKIYAAMASQAYRQVLGNNGLPLQVRLDPLEELILEDGQPDQPVVMAANDPVPTPDEQQSVFALLPAMPNLNRPSEQPEPAERVEEARRPDRTGLNEQPDVVAQAVPEPEPQPGPEPEPGQPLQPDEARAPSQDPGQAQGQAPSQVQGPTPGQANTTPAPDRIDPAPVEQPVEPLGQTEDQRAEDAKPDPAARLTARVRAWAQAWASQDVTAYLSFYSDEFQPQGGLSLAQWREQRRTRISRPPFINITLSNIVVTQQDQNTARVVFAQRYRSDVINDKVQKELVFQKENGEWRIIRERLDG